MKRFSVQTKRISVIAAVIAFLLLAVLMFFNAFVFQEKRYFPETLDVVSMQGETVNFASFRGKPIVINYWATWCPPCVRELPLLHQYDSRDDMHVILINQGETLDKIQQYLQQADLAFKNLLLDPVFATSETMQVRGLPTTFFYDANGVQVDLILGELKPANLENFVSEFVQSEFVQ